MGHRKRLVVDSDVLEKPMLFKYLNRSPSNMIVIPDFVGLEAYKGDPVENLSGKFVPLAKYAKQVLLLKNTSTVIKLHRKKHGLQQRLIDADQTRPFKALWSALMAAVQIAVDARFGLTGDWIGSYADPQKTPRKTAQAVQVTVQFCFGSSCG